MVLDRGRGLWAVGFYLGHLRLGEASRWSREVCALLELGATCLLRAMTCLLPQAATCIVLLTLAHIAVVAYAVQDHAFKRWLKFGGAATMLVASVVDVVIQVLTTAMSCIVFSIASQTFEDSSGYALFDQGPSDSVMVPFASHGHSWSGHDVSERSQ